MDVSVIIPAYNRLWCLPQAIDSCRNTNCKTEIIVIDDGSTDGTYEWLEQQPDLIVIRQAQSGKCRAVNNGFKIAKGKYIRFLDSDDLINNKANDEQFQLAELTNADIVVSGYKLFDDQNSDIKNQEWISCDDFIAQQLGECDSSHYSAYLFKKDFISDIPHRPDFAFRDDRLFVLEAALKYPVIAIHKNMALLHRINHSDRLQLGSGLKQSVQNFQHLCLYRNILSKLKSQQQLTERRIDASINVLWPLCKWIANYHLKDAEELYDWIVVLNPGFKIPDKGIAGFLFKNLGFTFAQKIIKAGRFIKYGWK